MAISTLYWLNAPTSTRVVCLARAALEWLNCFLLCTLYLSNVKESWSWNVVYLTLLQSKTKCRRSAFFRHFGEPSQDCNGILVYSCPLLIDFVLGPLILDLKNVLIIFLHLVRNVRQLCLIKWGQGSWCVGYVLTLACCFSEIHSFATCLESAWKFSSSAYLLSAYVVSRLTVHIS